MEENLFGGYSGGGHPHPTSKEDHAMCHEKTWCKEIQTGRNINGKKNWTKRITQDKKEL